MAADDELDFDDVLAAAKRSVKTDEGGSEGCGGGGAGDAGDENGKIVEPRENEKLMKGGFADEDGGENEASAVLASASTVSGSSDLKGTVTYFPAA